MTLQELKDQALGLDPVERERLACDLLHSLDARPVTDIDEAWVAEAERRLDELTSGKAKGIPGDKVFGRIRRDLGWQG